MAPLTRGLFVQYHTAYAPNASQDDISALWQAKTAQQKAEWVRLFNAADTALADLDTARWDPHCQLRVILNTLNHIPTAPLNTARAIRLRNRIEALLPDLQGLRSSFDHAIQAWSDLVDAEDAHPIPQGLEALNEQAENELHALRILDAEITGHVQRLLDTRAWPPVPSVAAGVQRMPERWAEDDPVYNEGKDNRYIADVHGADLTNQTLRLPGPTGALAGWIPAMDTEVDGDMNMGCVWLRLNALSRIQDRCFRKTAFLTEEQWRDPALWEGDIKDPSRKIPNELACHYTMQANAPNHIVSIRPQQYDHALVDDNTMSYRVYTEWCPQGDLNRLIYLHEHNNGPDFREDFIWEAALSMVRGGLGLANTSVVSHPGGTFTSGEIVHRDIKPGNYFLKFATDDDTYPTVLLADFGHSMKTHANDPNNPTWFRESGPVGFTAPEQRVWVDRATRARIPGPPLGQRTNVFNVGLVLWSMVRLQSSPPDVAFLGGNRDSHYNLSINYKNYSEDLLQMIRPCLRFDPSTRPTFQAMLVRIQAHYALVAAAAAAPPAPPAPPGSDDDDDDDDDSDDDADDDGDNQDGDVEDNGLRIDADPFAINTLY